MLNGHAAHQNGLDVDIWFNLDPKPPLKPAARETVPLWPVVLSDGSAVDPQRFGEADEQLLRLAAEDPAVDRIFVHWTIKRALCDAFAGAEGAVRDRRWLGRIRPWYGHDDHFHVRLRCPAGSSACVQQPAVPPGDGCDASLDWWASLHLAGPLPSPPTAKREVRVLPRECRALIAR
jgi:penicillin-insensitive murein endopeptidase